MAMTPDMSKMPMGMDMETYSESSEVAASRPVNTHMVPADYMQPAPLGVSQVPGVSAGPAFSPAVVQVQTAGMNGQGMGAGADGVQSVGMNPNHQQYGAQTYPNGYAKG